MQCVQALAEGVDRCMHARHMRQAQAALNVHHHRPVPDTFKQTHLRQATTPRPPMSTGSPARKGHGNIAGEAVRSDDARVSDGTRVNHGTGVGGVGSIS